MSYLAGVGLASFTLFLASLNYTGEWRLRRWSQLHRLGARHLRRRRRRRLADYAHLPRRPEQDRLGVKIAAGFLVLLWFAAVAFLTFDAPVERRTGSSR